MRRLAPPLYLYQRKGWPRFTWDTEQVLLLLSQVRHKQGRLRGYLEALGFSFRNETTLFTLTQDVLKSSEIEGEMLDTAQVRSSIARHLGIEVAGLVHADRNVEGVVEMMLDATQRFDEALTKRRLFAWHASLFPTGQSGMHKIEVGKWRKGPMQVVSGPMGKEKVHYEAPDAKVLDHEMKLFFEWFNKHEMDPVLKSAVGHLWFLTVHPFDDGNGRIARALADMLLARADGDGQRFYSMSAQIRLERNDYYHTLETTQKGTLDITKWLKWFLGCLDRSLDATDRTLKRVMNKTKFWDAHHQTEINERQRMMVNKLFEGFEGKLTSSKWAKITKCSPDTALRDISDLMQKGILEKEQGGGRSTSYMLVE